MTTRTDSAQAQWETDFQQAFQTLTTDPTDEARVDAIASIMSSAVVDGSVPSARVERVTEALLRTLRSQPEPVQNAILDAIEQLPPARAAVSGLLGLLADSTTPAALSERARTLLLQPTTRLPVIVQLTGLYANPATPGPVREAIEGLLGGTDLPEGLRDLRQAARLNDQAGAGPAIQALASLAVQDPQRLTAARAARAALRALVERDGPGSSYPQPDPRLRAQVLQALAAAQELDVVLRALLDDEESVRAEVAGYLEDQKTARRVTSGAISDALIHIFADNTAYQSANIRPEAVAARLVRVMRPASEEGATDREALPRRLIAAAVDAQRRQDERLVNLLAVLLETSVGDQDRAGDLITRYQRENRIPDSDLVGLRSQIGGRVTLAPIMGALEANLITYFQEPIKLLNTDTQQNWQKTIRYAQYGFVVRMIMSVVVFLVGVGLVIASAGEFLFGGRSGDQLWGPGVTLAGGLAAMFAVVYTGPLKDIRQSINDLGVASAIFIGYVHRVLEISHTFSFYYLNKTISYDEMTRSSALIAAAMRDIHRMLPHDPPTRGGIPPLDGSPTPKRIRLVTRPAQRRVGRAV